MSGARSYKFRREILPRPGMCAAASKLWYLRWPAPGSWRSTLALDGGGERTPRERDIVERCVSLGAADPAAWSRHRITSRVAIAIEWASLPNSTYPPARSAPRARLDIAVGARRRWRAPKNSTSQAPSLAASHYREASRAPRVWVCAARLC